MVVLFYANIINNVANVINANQNANKVNRMPKLTTLTTKFRTCLFLLHRESHLRNSFAKRHGFGTTKYIIVYFTLLLNSFTSAEPTGY